MPAPVTAPYRRGQLWQGITAGALAAAFTLWLGWKFPGIPRDFDQFWFAARAVLRGDNPYDLIGPGRLFVWPWPFVYPLTAAVLAMPLAPFHVLAARCLFVGVSVGLLAFAMPTRLLAPMLVSQPFVNALWNAQWSPLLTAAMLLPALGMLGMAKPQIGVALLAHCGTWRQARFAIVGGLGLVVASLLMRHDWPTQWIAAIASNPRYSAPVLHPGGIVLLAAGLRWRDPNARLLLVLALTPHTPMWYSVLPLFLIPRTLAEGTLLAGLSQIAFFATAFVPHPDTFDAQLALNETLLLIFLYLPALGLILRRPAQAPQELRHAP